MTAEIAVMNKSALALAADSVITVTMGPNQTKTYDSVNKLFSLSRLEPVGLMVYGNAEILDVPWETVIKEFRAQLESKRFDSLSDYAKEFVKFLASSDFFPSDVQSSYVAALVEGYALVLLSELEIAIETHFRRSRKRLKPTHVKRMFHDIVERHLDKWSDRPILKQYPPGYEATLLKDYSNVIRDAWDSTLEKTPVFKKTRRLLTRIGVLILCRDEFSLSHSGVVIAGFGSRDPFPRVISFLIDGIASGYVKHREFDEKRTTHVQGAWIIPFAQAHMVQTFMEGIDPAFESERNKYIKSMLGGLPRQILNKIPDLPTSQQAALAKQLQRFAQDESKRVFDQFAKYKYEHFIAPVVDTVGVLPKDQLAEMAEALVSLTAFKQRVSGGAETVGGAIDVAVISKSDGFIWIRRKHYFDPNLNHQFFVRHYGSK